MSITIKKVTSKADLKRFIRFNYHLYKGNPYAVPDFLEDMLDTYHPRKNAAFDFCEAEFFLALRGDEVVGRVVGIINHKANRTWKAQNARFGWIDFIDDQAVSAALMNTVEQWAREKGCDKVIGPLGFTDLDPEGMLIDGFDQLSTMSSIYNYPYYPQHMERLGYDREVDWVERLIQVPQGDTDETQERFLKLAEVVKRRNKLRVRKFKSVKEIRENDYVYKIFDVVNRAYAPLFGYSEISRGQVDNYADQYLQFLDLRLLTAVETEEGEPIAMGVGMASLSHALQKAKGKLFPLGWFHLLKALYWKRSEYLDLLLVAVLPEYQNKGVHTLLFADIIPIAKEMGFKYAETHPQLETNEKGQSLWNLFDATIHKRRRCYQKVLETPKQQPQ